MKLYASALSDIGKVRKGNEDAFALLPERGLFIVSDGMGGHQAGEAASKIVVSVLPGMVEQQVTSVPNDQPETISHALRDMIVELSQRVHQQSAGQAGLAGMGATVVLTYFRGEKAFIAHMGDSRAYLYRRRKLKQLTDDHSLVGILLRHGDITPEEAKVHPGRSRLSRYVGMEGEIYPDVQSVRLAVGDRILLCSDGLTGVVADQVISEILSGSEGPVAACRALVEAANACGGPDNITVLLIDCMRRRKGTPESSGPR